MEVLKFPLAKITIAFIFGILLSDFSTISIPQLFTLSSVLGCILAFMYLAAKSDFYQKLYFGLAVFMLSMIIGMLTVALNKSANNPYHYYNHMHINGDKKFRLAVTLKEELKPTKKNNRYVADVTYIGTERAQGRVLLNINRNSSNSKFIIGSQLLLFAKINENSKPLNPDQFDYAKYLSRKSIGGQIYTSHSAIILLPSPEKSIYYYTDKLRKRIIYNLEQSALNKRELGVLSALILGQRQEIAPDILQHYQYAGAVHILSVSGLHVGFIVLFLNKVLFFLPKKPNMRILKLIITLVCLWMFAILASLSPSVVRAVTMFSFVAIGMYLNRQTNVFHTLLVSILIILLITPSFIFDVGFQLSYIALFSIIWLQPMIKKLWTPGNRFVGYFWDILTVSFAAQIGAFPISVYYFHQFPGLFFVTNILVIPLLSIIMALGIIAMSIAVFSQVPKFIIITLEFCIKIMNDCIEFVASFEQFVFKDIPMNFLMLILTYIAIISIIKFYNNPTYLKLTSTLTLLILLSSLHIATTYLSERKSQLIVFNQRNNNILLEKNGRKLYIHSTDKLANWDQIALQSFATANYLSIKECNPIRNYYYFNGQKILIIDSNSVWIPNAKSDIVILMKSPKINLSRAIASLKPKVIVADATNYSYLKQNWAATCQKENIPFHDTSEKGYFKLE